MLEVVTTHLEGDNDPQGPCTHIRLAPELATPLNVPPFWVVTGMYLKVVSAVIMTLFLATTACRPPCQSGVRQLGDGDIAHCRLGAVMRIERTGGPILVHCTCKADLEREFARDSREGRD